jgi:hypothetical protein
LELRWLFQAWNNKHSFAVPFCPIPPIGAGHIIVPVENEHVLHLYKMHHSHGALTSYNVQLREQVGFSRLQEDINEAA